VTLTWHLRSATPLCSSWTAFCARQTVTSAVQRSNRFCESVPLLLSDGLVNTSRLLRTNPRRGTRIPSGLLTIWTNGPCVGAAAFSGVSIPKQESEFDVISENVIFT